MSTFFFFGLIVIILCVVAELGLEGPIISWSQNTLCEFHLQYQTWCQCCSSSPWTFQTPHWSLTLASLWRLRSAELNFWWRNQSTTSDLTPVLLDRSSSSRRKMHQIGFGYLCLIQHALWYHHFVGRVPVIEGGNLGWY